MVAKEHSVKELKHKARRCSIKEGIFSSARSSFGDRFIHPFAIAINTSNPLVALLSSISGLLGPLSQLFSSRIFEKQSRKKIVMGAVLIESLMWMPFIAIAILFAKGILTNFLPLFFLLSFSIYIIMANASHPFWFSWMGDVVDEEYRGRWFSKRHLIASFVSVIVAIFASLFLDYFKKINLIMIGFVILFSLALISRLISWSIFKKQYEPKLRFKKENYFSFLDFLKEAPKNNFGRFTIFRALLGFGGTISGSLFAVYLLRHLGFSYLIYMIIIFAEIVFSLVVLNLWGKLSDKYGNYRVLVLTTIIIPTTSILWVLHPSPIYLILVPALVGGIAWGGFTIAVGNFIYDNVSKQKRSFAVSYYNMLFGIGCAFGAGVAALLIKFLNISLIAPIVLIFIISGIVQMIIVSIWIPKIKEVRKTEKMTPKTLEKVIIRGIKPTIREEIHEIASIGHYLKE